MDRQAATAVMTNKTVYTKNINAHTVKIELKEIKCPLI